MNKIKVIMIRPDSVPYMTNISNTLENLQRNVEGYIETVTAADDMVIICNEEGRLQNRPHCCRIAGIDFVGTVIIAGVKGDEFTDVPITLKEFHERWEGK